MIIRCCLFVLVIATSHVGLAQQHADLDPSKAVPFDELFRLLVPPAEVEERVFLFQDWQQGAVFLSQGRFTPDVNFKYDVLNHALLVLVDEKELSLNTIAVDSILMNNRPQVLINPIILDGVDSEFLLLRVYNGPLLSLFRSTLAEVIDRDINTAAITKFKYSPEEVQIEQEQGYSLFHKSTGEMGEFQGRKKGNKKLGKWRSGIKFYQR